jgi:hypothetical protein
VNVPTLGWVIGEGDALLHHCPDRDSLISEYLLARGFYDPADPKAPTFSDDPTSGQLFCIRAETALWYPFHDLGGHRVKWRPVQQDGEWIACYVEDPSLPVFMVDNPRLRA